MPSIKVVDLFAGPGGLAEGFSRFRVHHRRGRFPFEVCVSAEKDMQAHATLRLRAFYRLCERYGEVPESYYQYLKGELGSPFEAAHEELWERAGQEALNLTLGEPDDNAALDRAVRKAIKPGEDWVLIGGPPCQAYSVVGRARNKGVKGYRAEADERHYLYKEYLRMLAFRGGPVAFVMENVKGILSAEISGARIFPKILRDLSAPGLALGVSSRHRYKIHSLCVPAVYEFGSKTGSIDVRDFIVRAEEYGVPQARHRVILVGVRADIGGTPQLLKPVIHSVSTKAAISGLPKIRSASSNFRSEYSWSEQVRDAFREAVNSGLRKQASPDVWARMEHAVRNLPKAQKLSEGSPYTSKPVESLFSASIGVELKQWLQAPRLGGVIDHKARPHMPADIVRYMYCAALAESEHRSPTSRDFPASLAPDHKNWDSGGFADRFRVQLASRPASTITSHISKDGHYFIHPSVDQLRSLTVREAARLQTFPDDYAFQGSRTARYGQVGNAVPPYLAGKIAESVFSVLK